ncbi:MAG: hypothetical protein HQM10_00840 [Candidatus Riflebacteria bacterium]|nr:hypothetical protein [Candidatus Riflebacteria bacterium]
MLKSIFLAVLFLIFFSFPVFSLSLCSLPASASLLPFSKAPSNMPSTHTYEISTPSLILATSTSAVISSSVASLTFSDISTFSSELATQSVKISDSSSDSEKLYAITASEPDCLVPWFAPSKVFPSEIRAPGKMHFESALSKTEILWKTVIQVGRSSEMLLKTKDPAFWFDDVKSSLPVLHFPNRISIKVLPGTLLQTFESEIKISLGRTYLKADTKNSSFRITSRGGFLEVISGEFWAEVLPNGNSTFAMMKGKAWIRSITGEIISILPGQQITLTPRGKTEGTVEVDKHWKSVETLPTFAPVFWIKKKPFIAKKSKNASETESGIASEAETKIASDAETVIASGSVGTITENVSDIASIATSTTATTAASINASATVSQISSGTALDIASKTFHVIATETAENIASGTTIKSSSGTVSTATEPVQKVPDGYEMPEPESSQKSSE